jgi:hypothetical protein
MSSENKRNSGKEIIKKGKTKPPIERPPYSSPPKRDPQGGKTKPTS